MEQNEIPEADVLIATTAYLMSRGVIPIHFSLTREINIEQYRKRLTDAFEGLNVNPTFSRHGADIIGFSTEEWWQVECKGAGSGTSQTYRNNFDRALASVVSYYEDAAKDLPEFCQAAIPFLGLAFPLHPVYMRQLTRRVRKPLRVRLNLWILLYDSKSKSIKAISPADEY